MSPHFWRSNFITVRFEPIKIAQPPPPAKKRELPPYNGIGSDEDSLSSCLYLIPKPPRKDFDRFMDKDRWVWLDSPFFFTAISMYT